MAGKWLNWIDIQDFYDAGHAREECLEKFNIHKSTWYTAIRKGRLEATVKKSSLEEVLANGNPQPIKARLIRDRILINRCAICDCEPVWLGKPLILRLDHINGINDDWRVENLRLLCPNCDSQTPTFCGRNIKATKNRKSSAICR